MLAQLESLSTVIRWWDVVDITIVSVVLYRFYLLIENTRAASLLKGLLVIVLAALCSNWLELHVISWLLQKSMTVLLVALPVVFQPELRRALEQLGEGTFFARTSKGQVEAQYVLDYLTSAVLQMAKHKIGALIVIERDISLGYIIETGVKLDAFISNELLINIFIPNTPLHDGAVILRGDRIVAAACLLPLTEARDLSKELGTRHRAAIGVTEQSDALTLVVSEETGTISITVGGSIRRDLTGEDINNILLPVFATEPTNFKVTMKKIVNNWRGSKK